MATYPTFVDWGTHGIFRESENSEKIYMSLRSMPHHGLNFYEYGEFGWMVPTAKFEDILDIWLKASINVGAMDTELAASLRQEILAHMHMEIALRGKNRRTN